MNMRASLEKFRIFQYSVGTSDTLSQKHIYFQVSNYICIVYMYNQCSFLLLLMVYGVIYKQQYTDKTLT